MSDDFENIFRFDPNGTEPDDRTYVTPRQETALWVVVAVALLAAAFVLGRESVNWWAR